jgi:hypothetical protein
VAAMGAHTEVAYQLVVAIVRAAARAGVRVALRRRLVGYDPLVLDRDIDALRRRHPAILEPLASRST